MRIYKKLIDNYGMDIAEKAGYIKPFPCIDLLKAQEYSPVTDNYCLVTTGCFSPLHSGHVNMMNSAKEWLEAQNKIVDFGYFVLAHQNYIDEKHGRFTLEERQYLAQELIGDYNWLNIDLRANIYYENDTNFTQIMDELYNKSKNLVYVFGSDRYEFGYTALTDNRLYICVIRDKKHINKVSELYNKLNLSNLIYIVPKEIDNNSSSKCYKNVVLPEKRNYNKLAIRNDGLMFLPKNYIEPYKEFCEDLENAFKLCSSFKSIEWVDVNKQLSNVPKFKNKVISLDKYYKGDIQLNISRYFELSGQQKYAKDLVESTFFNEEIDLKPLSLNLDKDNYILIDDDSVSGYTIKKLSEEVNKIIDTYTLMEDKYDDVVDVRDFLFGTKYGGLLCKKPNGKLKRYSYIWPDVNLYYRASIDLNKQKIFSDLIVKANNKFWNKVKNI